MVGIPGTVTMIVPGDQERRNFIWVCGGVRSGGRPFRVPESRSLPYLSHQSHYLSTNLSAQDEISQFSLPRCQRRGESLVTTSSSD